MPLQQVLDQSSLSTNQRLAYNCKLQIDDLHDLFLALCILALYGAT